MEHVHTRRPVQPRREIVRKRKIQHRRRIITSNSCHLLYAWVSCTGTYRSVPGRSTGEDAHAQTVLREKVGVTLLILAVFALDIVAVLLALAK